MVSNKIKTNLWLDQKNAEEILLSKTKNTYIINKTKSMIKDGFVVIRRAISSRHCNRIVKDFNKYCANYKKESDSFTLKTGLHSRLCNFHLTSISASNAIIKPEIMKLLDFWFESEAAVCTSLFFEQSSEQSIHRDSPFFCTKPYGLFFGVWFALEDIEIDAGPLIYYPGMHKEFIDRFEIGKSIGKDGKPYEEYLNHLRTLCNTSNSEKKVALIKKGDAFIWHPELPHGGAAIISPGKTRKSIVFHCMPKKTSVYGLEEFFGFKDYDGRVHDLKEIKNDFRTINGLKNIFRNFSKSNKSSGRFMINHGDPKFEVNV